MAQRDDRKRLGKKHRDPSTRPKKGRAPRVTPTTGAVDPRKRKVLSTKRAALEKKKRTPTRSPENESRRTLAPKPQAPKKPAARATRPADGIVGRQTPNSANIGRPEPDSDAADARAWDRAEQLATQLDLAAPGTLRLAPGTLPLIAICGRPNVGKSTLFNRLTGSRRSIVGDEPGITRDRIYGEIEWQSADARIVDTGGIIPDDLALIPAEIFRQAQTALTEADAIIMVIDGRTELASPDLQLARLLLRSGKPVFLAVNKIDTEALAPAAENFRRLGFTNVQAISAEHNIGIGDLLDEVFAVLPAPKVIPPEAFLTEADEFDEDATGPDYTPPPGADLAPPNRVFLSGAQRAQSKDPDTADITSAARRLSASESFDPNDPDRPRRLRSHGSFEEHETKIAIIGRPNVGKSTLLNALTGTDRAIVSPIAGTTRDAVDEVVTRGSHDFRFVDTAGIRRKGKTHLMAEKLSVIMARKHLEAADVSLLVLDATEGVTALDANIGGYAHESGRSVIIVVNKWDLVTHPATNNPTTNSNPNTSHPAPGHHQARVPEPARVVIPPSVVIPAKPESQYLSSSQPPPKVDQKLYEQQVRDHLKYLDYAPLVFLSAVNGKGIEALFKKIELVARERRKRVTTGQMNRFLAKVDFQKASVPMNRRVRIYYMTQAAVAPPTFVLFTDKDVKLHFAFERFLANQIRANFGFIGAPIWFKTRPRNKKKPEE